MKNVLINKASMNVGCYALGPFISPATPNQLNLKGKSMIDSIQMQKASNDHVSCDSKEAYKQK